MRQTPTHTHLYNAKWVESLSLFLSHSLFYSHTPSLLLFAGNLILHTKMAVEILGGWQDSCAHHGLRYRHLFRSREKTKKEITFRLFMGKFKVSLHWDMEHDGNMWGRFVMQMIFQISQLVGVQILRVWAARPNKCDRWVTWVHQHPYHHRHSFLHYMVPCTHIMNCKQLQGNCSSFPAN